jgi:hypothetical protein
MPKKPKIEKDYEEYNAAIECKTQEEIQKIKQKIAKVKKEAEKVGETLESKSGKNQPKTEEKS